MRVRLKTFLSDYPEIQRLWNSLSLIVGRVSSSGLGFITTMLTARLYADSTRQARIMTALVESAASFGGSLELQVAWDLILSQTIRTPQVETAAIGMLSAEEGQVVFRAAAGEDGTSIVGQTMPRSQGPITNVLTEGRVVKIAIL